MSDELRRMRREQFREGLRLAQVPERYVVAMDLEQPLPAQLADWRGDPWSVLIAGPIGTGKTWLAVRLMAEVLCDDTRLMAGRDALFVQCSELVEALRQEIGSPSDGVWIGKALQTRVLILDDFGAERDTEFARDRLRMIVGHRYNGMQPTIFTTNAANLAELRDLDPRLASRMREGLTFALSGPDRRQRPGPRPVGVA